MKKNSIEKNFLILSLIFGIILLFVVPPFQSPDESAHFLKAYEISTGDFFPNTKNDKSGYCISNNLLEYISKKDSYASNLKKKYSYSDIYYEQLLAFNYHDKCTFRSIAPQNITVFAHIIPASGIFIARHLNIYSQNSSNGPAVLIQFARLFCLIIYSLICYLAIKITPKYKKSMFVILLLPNSLLLRTMVSYDGLLLSVIALSIALMLNLICNNKSKFNIWYFIWFIFAAYILLNIKVIYAFIFLLMFVIPNEQFEGKNKKIKTYIIMILIALFIIILGKIPYLGLNSSEPDIVIKQMAFIKAHPLNTILKIGKNIIDQFSTQTYWMFAAYGLLDTYMPQLFVFLLGIWLFIVIISDMFNQYLKISKIYKILLLILSIISIFGIYGIMYLSWTPKVLNIVGGSEITGVQGRYYLPYLLLIPIIFSNKIIDIKRLSKVKNIFKKIDQFIENNYTYVVSTSLILVVIFIFIRFYV